jgi:hypothetical protein
MSDEALSPDEMATLIDYARRKYAEERWPLAPELRRARPGYPVYDRGPPNTCYAHRYLATR